MKEIWIPVIKKMFEVYLDKIEDLEGGFMILKAKKVTI